MVAVPFLLALNAFFVGAEYAVVAIRSDHIHNMRGRGRVRSANAMARLKTDAGSAIAAVQVCITMANLLMGWLGEPAMTALLENLFGLVFQRHPVLFGTIATAVGFFIVTLLTVVFSELLPKALTLQHVETVAMLTAVPILAITRISWPLVGLMNAVASLVTRPLGLGRVGRVERAIHTSDEIRLIASEAAADGVLSERERSLILNSLTLGKRAARQIMVPRVKVAYLDLQRSMDENRAVMNEYLYSRLPLCNGGMDHVIGIVHTKEFLSAYNEAADSSVLSLIARPAVFAPEMMPLDRLLTFFVDKNTRFVLLAAEHGGVEGIVTLRDVIDELVAVSAVTQQEGSGMRRPLEVGGDMPLNDLARQLGRERLGDDDSIATVGGLIAARLGRIPLAGDQVVVDGCGFQVTETDGRTARRVAVMPPA